MNHFLQENFDKLLLVFLILIFVSVMIFSKNGQDFAQRTIDICTGALVSIITGKFLASRANPPNDQQNPH